MKHIHKYIFVPIIALLLTSTLQAAPKAFDSLGNELEAMQKDCKQYFQDPQVSKKLQTACKKLNTKVDKAFKAGYPLDASVESDTASEKKTSRYLTLLRKASESRDNLIEIIKSNTINARRDSNIKYFRFLIDYNKIVLSSKNYEFMKQHHVEFQDNPIYKQAIIREAERKIEKKKAKEEEIAIAKEEAAKKKQRSTKVISFRPYISPSEYQNMVRQSHNLADEIEEKNRRSFDRLINMSNQQAQRGSSSLNNIGQLRRELMHKREFDRQYENW